MSIIWSLRLHYYAKWNKSRSNPSISIKNNYPSIPGIIDILFPYNIRSL